MYAIRNKKTGEWANWGEFDWLSSFGGCFKLTRDEIESKLKELKEYGLSEPCECNDLEIVELKEVE